MSTTRLQRLFERFSCKRSVQRKIVFTSGSKYQNTLFQNYSLCPLLRTAQCVSRDYVSNRLVSRSDHSITWIIRHLDFLNVSEWPVLLRRMLKDWKKLDCLCDYRLLRRKTEVDDLSEILSATPIVSVALRSEFTDDLTSEILVGNRIKNLHKRKYIEECELKTLESKSLWDHNTYSDDYKNYPTICGRSMLNRTHEKLFD